MLRIAKSAIDAMVREAEEMGEEECCGLLLGQSEAEITAFRPAANVHPTPRTHFEIDPAVLIDALRNERGGGPRVLGYYHSHPHGPAHPSGTDRAMAQPDGMVWAILAAGCVNFWRAGDAGFVPLPYEPTGG